MTKLIFTPAKGVVVQSVQLSLEFSLHTIVQQMDELVLTAQELVQMIRLYLYHVSCDDIMTNSGLSMKDH